MRPVTARPATTVHRAPGLRIRELAKDFRGSTMAFPNALQAPYKDIFGTEIPALYVKGSGWDLAVRSPLNAGPYLLSMLSHPPRTLLPGPRSDRTPLSLLPLKNRERFSRLCDGRVRRSLARSSSEVFIWALAANEDGRASPTSSPT